MTEIFKLIGKITMDGVDYVEKSLKSIEKSTDKTATGFDKLAVRSRTVLKALPGIIGGATVAIGAVVSAMAIGVKTSADFADGIDKTAKRLQMTTDSSQKFDYVMRGVGGSLEDLSGGIQKLQKNAGDAYNGNKDLADLFENKLGISIRDVNGNLKNSTELFEDAIFALTKIENPTLRATMAQDLFGKSAQSLMPLLSMSNAEIKEQIANAEKYGQVLDKDTVASLDSAGDAIDTYNVAMKNAKAEIMSGFAPALEKLALKAAEVATNFRKIFNPGESEAYTIRGNYVTSQYDKKITQAKRELETLKKYNAAADAISEQEFKIAELEHNRAVNKGMWEALASGDTGSATTKKPEPTKTETPSDIEDLEKTADEAAAYEIKKQADIDKEVEARMQRRDEIRKKNTQAVIDWETDKEQEKIQNQADLDAQRIDDKLDNDKELAKEELKIDEELADSRSKLAEMEKELQKERYNNLQDEISFIGSYAAQVGQIFTQMYDNKIAAIENAESKEISAINNSKMSEEEKTAAIEKIQVEAEKKKKALARKQAIANKVTGIFEIGINTAVGIMKSMTLAWPMNLVMAALTAGMGIAETAVVASKPIPAAKGLYAPAQSGGVNTLIAEGKQDEIVFPLVTGVELLADMLMSKLMGLTMPSQQAFSGGINNQMSNSSIVDTERQLNLHLHIGNFYGDDTSYKQLERKLKTIRISESQRTGSDIGFAFA